MNLAAQAQKTKYDPEGTRLRLLEAAFAEIHRTGFRAASLDRILENAGVTKGALYHHFGSKTKLGYAVVEELLAAQFEEMWVEPLERAENPLQALTEIVESMSQFESQVEIGCPLNNLANEMSPIDEGFRERLGAIFRHWRESVARALQTAKDRGLIREDVLVGQTASFIVSVMEGTATTAKNAQDINIFHDILAQLKIYLNSLQPA